MSDKKTLDAGAFCVELGWLLGSALEVGVDQDSGVMYAGAIGRKLFALGTSEADLAQALVSALVAHLADSLPKVDASVSLSARQVVNNLPDGAPLRILLKDVSGNE